MRRHPAPHAPDVSSRTCPPAVVDRLIVHQVDLAAPIPGGIDTCIRGLCRYAPPDMVIAVVGVDASGDRRRVGRWERATQFPGEVHFLPVLHLEAGDQRRLVPHSLRLARATLAHWQQLPRSSIVQAHRADMALLLLALLRRPLAYFVHTQGGGLTHDRSDSFWRWAAAPHRAVELFVTRRAAQVAVFNEDYAAELRRYNDAARFSPTWWDPELIRFDSRRAPSSIVWAGRLEVPKDPLLALEAFQFLYRSRPDEGWRLHLAGGGSLRAEVEGHIARLPADVRAAVSFHGPLPPDRLAELMAGSRVLLMTSHPRYEGYPRVLVEALASGCTAVVTEGSDTGGLLRAGVNGMTTTRNPADIARAIPVAAALGPDEARASVLHLAAPLVIRKLLAEEEPAVTVDSPEYRGRTAALPGRANPIPTWDT